MKLSGSWNKDLYLESSNMQKELLVEKNKKFPGSEYMFGFPKWSVITSNLTKEQINFICPTDSRLRPDQRAYENGDVELAASEKHRLEELQRGRRRLRKTNNEEFTPRWFEKTIDPDVNVETFTYRGGYWETRETGNWDEWKFGKTVDLYND